jgi:uncharacterized protein YjiS (DUF1127 family)
MSCRFQGRSAATFAQRRPFSWRAIFNAVVERARSGLARRRQRLELLDYMANDHRAAADIGITSYEARNWSERPFWRA